MKALEQFHPRKLIHIGVNGAIAAVAFITPPQYLFPLTTLAFFTVFLVENIRLNTNIRQTLNQKIKTILKKHERDSFSGIFWIALAGLIGSTLGNPLAMSFGFAVFATADPAAAIVGSKVNGPKIYEKKSLAGSAAFFIVASLVTFGFLWYVGMIQQMLLITFGLAALLTLVELFSYKVDDNFTVLLSGILLMHFLM